LVEKIISMTRVCIMAGIYSWFPHANL